MITVWKAICEEFKNWNLAQGGMKLDPDRKESVRRQKYSLSAPEGCCRQMILGQGREQEGKEMWQQKLEQKGATSCLGVKSAVTGLRKWGEG